MNIQKITQSFSMAGKLLVVPAIALLAYTPANAGVLVTEPFAFDGNFNGSSGGSGFAVDSSWSATPYGTMTVSDGVMTIDPDAGASGNTAFTFRNLSTSYSGSTDATYYISFTGQNASDGTRFFGFNLFNDDTSVVGVGQPAGGSNWSFFGGATGDTGIASSTKSLLVLRIDVSATGDDTVSLYVNPGTSEPVSADASTTIADATFNRMRFASGYSFSGQTTVVSTYENLIMGTEWSDVVAVPEPAEWSLIFGIAALLALGLRRRLRRQA